MKNQLADCFNEFGLRLFKQLPTGNCFFSPMSIAIALSALIPGARGKTYEELEGVLNLRLSSVKAQLEEAVRELMVGLQAETSSKLHLANGLFIQQDYSILESYREVLEAAYMAGIFSVDFRLSQAMKQINQWAERKTNGMIRHLLGELSKETKLVLANAIYFKALWRDPFDGKLTEKKPFYLGRRIESFLRQELVPVDMMLKTSTFRYMKNRQIGFEALDIQYEDRNHSLLLVLPAKRKLCRVEQALDPDLLGEVWTQLESTLVHLELPKLDMDCRYTLNDSLKKLGIRTAYSDQANFSGITDDPLGLKISGAIHQARMQVDEEGTEAAAATAIMMEVTCSLFPTRTPHPIPFIVNRPFIFLIHDRRTGAILFIGRVVNPNQKTPSENH